MLRLILIAVVVALMGICGVAIALNHYFGWKGLVVLPFLVIGLVWFGKVVIGKLIKQFFLGLFSMKSRVLRGATMTVHSVTPVAKPPEPELTEDDVDMDEEAEDEDQDAKDEEPEEPEEPRNYFDVDVTITPKATCEDRVWEPTELILTSEKISSLEDLQADEDFGTVESVLIWDGSKFGPDDPGKYPGEQRLKITFAVKPGVSKGWVHYYDEPIGVLELPPWSVG